MADLKTLVEELEETLSKDSFTKFTSPAELHYLAQNWPWETREEIQILHWICESDICSKATALMVFWLAQPQDYTCYKFGTKVPYDDGTFTLIQIILNRFEQGDYQHYGIHYDPHANMPDENYEINEQMKEAVTGEETWYDEDYIKKIAWYVPDELQSEIRRADKDYLNMMANGLYHFRDAADVAELIIQNPHCDKGTALLLYWRLLAFCANRGFSPIEAEEKYPVLRELHEKLLSEQFCNGIAYEPLKDKENDKLLGKRKDKWTIPEYMKQAV